MSTTSSEEKDARQEGDSTKPKKWKRVCGRRVKTGCRTCKTRRIKCDELRPECLKCQLSGRKCDGYVPLDAVVDRRQRRRSAEFTTSSSVATATVSKPSRDSTRILTTLYTDIMGEPCERRSFHHFRACTASDLSGAFHSNFWNRLVLQLCHSEPAIKHALIALGAAHETYQAGGVENINRGLALQQYNKSIACLNQQLSNPGRRNTEVALICCVLFICFESIRYNYDAALLHLESGIEILKNKLSGPISGHTHDVPYLDPQTDEDELIELFTRLDFSASAFLDIRPPQLPLRWSNDAFFVPDSFRSLAEARRCLEKLVNFALYLVISHYEYRGKPELQPAEAECERVKLIAAVQHWAVRFDALLKSPAMTGKPSRDLQGAFTLIIHQKTITIMLESSPFSDRRMYVRFEKEIESIVSIASWLVSSACQPGTAMPSTDSASCSPPTFTADMGIIAPLYLVSMNSPNEEIRRRAMGILSTPRREGLWDSVLIANIAEKAMDAKAQGIIDEVQGSVIDLAKALGASSSLPLI